MSRGNPAILATAARISVAEDVAALAGDIADAVGFIAERCPGAADEEELIRILVAVVKLKRIASHLRQSAQPAS